VPETVLSRGRVVYEDGKVTGKPGDGQFIRRAEHMGTLSAPPAPSSALRIS
jgi:N-acyl-D-aspartate/D-glutamate deacylase